MANCIDHPSEGGHPDDVCGYCARCLGCEGGDWADHAFGCCTEPKESESFSELAQAIASRVEWEDTWQAAGEPSEGPVWALYNYACEHEATLIIRERHRLSLA